MADDDVDPSPQPRVRTEAWIGLVFVVLSSLFLIEIWHYLRTGEWVVHGGAGAFARWPMPAWLNLELGLHALGMLAWVGVVIHQLLTRGAGHHRRVGQIGLVGVFLALAASLRPTIASDVPVLHGAFGASLMDWTLGITVVGIVAETAIAIYKVRRGNVEGHRKHVMTAVLFTAGPGLYRVNVEWLTWALDLRGAEASIWQTTWVHEISLAATLLAFLLLMFTPRLGGHLDSLRRPETHDAFERIYARVMLGVVVSLIVLFSVWVVDLIRLWPGESPLIERGDTWGAWARAAD